MVPFPPLRTARLDLRLLGPDDAEAVHRHFADERVTRYMDIEALQSVHEAEEIIRFHLRDTGCRWGLFLRADDALVGTCGYHAWEAGEVARAEIGFDLAYAAWGRGLMREALAPVLEVGSGTMGLDVIEATIDPANARSIALVTNLGFEPEPEPALRDGLRVFRRMRPSPRQNST